MGAFGVDLDVADRPVLFFEADSAAIRALQAGTVKVLGLRFVLERSPGQEGIDLRV